MKPFSRKIREIELSPIRKFSKYAAKAQKDGKKVYFINIGQPDIKTPKSFWDAVKGYDKEVLEYEASSGYAPLIESMIEYYRGYGVDYSPEDISVTNGGSEALTIAMLVICDEGDEIIVPEPYYTNYSTFVKSAGAKIVPVSTSPEEGYRYADREKIQNRITDRTKAIMISNPANPTGLVLTTEERRLIADIAKENDLFIIADEVYREFIYGDEKPSSFGQMQDIADRLIVIDSISKRFSACGARIGALISKNKQLQEEVLKYLQGRLCSPTLDQVGAVELYRMDYGYFADVKAEYQARRDVVYDMLQEIDGVVCEKPNGAFYIMAKLPVDSAEDFLVFLLTEFSDEGETIMFAPAQGFYETEGLGKSEVRIAYVLNKRDMTRAMEILKKGLIAYNKR